MKCKSSVPLLRGKYFVYRVRNATIQRVERAAKIVMLPVCVFLQSRGAGENKEQNPLFMRKPPTVSIVSQSEKCVVSQITIFKRLQIYGMKCI
jgi:hypothetical protein